MEGGPDATTDAAPTPLDAAPDSRRGDVDAAEKSGQLSGVFLLFNGTEPTDGPAWTDLCRELKSLRISTIVIQLTTNSSDVDGQAFEANITKIRSLQAACAAVDAGMEIFVGGFYPEPNGNAEVTFGDGSVGCPAFLDAGSGGTWLQSSERCSTSANVKILARLGDAGTHCYIPTEFWTAEYDDAQVRDIRTFLIQVAASCRGDGVMTRKVAISPFVDKEAGTANAVAATWARILADAGVNHLMLQDGVGALSGPADRAGPYYRSLNEALATALGTGGGVWANVESFEGPSDAQHPTDAGRFAAQRNAAVDAGVHRLITFEFLDYFSSNPPGLGQSCAIGATYPDAQAYRRCRNHDAATTLNEAYRKEIDAPAP